MLFIKSNHVQFENMKDPLGHVYEGERFIDIILEKDREETLSYYRSYYKGYDFYQGDLKVIILIISLTILLS